MFNTILRKHVLHRVTFNPDQTHFTSSLLITSLNNIMERREPFRLRNGTGVRFARFCKAAELREAEGCSC
jgi:hypothetical protein